MRTSLIFVRLIKMALVHDLAEAVVGDITPYDGVSKVPWPLTPSESIMKAEKHAREVKGLQTIVAALPPHIGKEIFDLFMEYETGTSAEAIQLKDIDMFEMILQAFEYEKGGAPTLQEDLAPLCSSGQVARRFFPQHRRQVQDCSGVLEIPTASLPDCCRFLAGISSSGKLVPAFLTVCTSPPSVCCCLAVAAWPRL